MGGLIAWRHPKPRAASGLCIGRTDVQVDPRKSKRLAHRIRAWARRQAAPRVVVTSPLRRCADVGRWLASWGWRHHCDARLAEIDFGDWDGRLWSDVGAAAVDAWCLDFASHRPGGGEAVATLLERCAAFIDERHAAPLICSVTHAGWLSAACWLRQSPDAVPQAAAWPPAIAHGQRLCLRAVGASPHPR